MDISNIFKQLHGILDPSKLIKLQTRPDIVKLEVFKQCVEYLKVDPNNIYYDPENMINRFVYYDGLLYWPLNAFDLKALEMFHTKDAIHHQLKRFHELLAKKNFKTLFHIIDKKILIPAFIKYYKDIDKSSVYDVFINLYQRTEYGFDKIPKNIINFCLAQRHLSSDWQERIVELKTKTKNKDFIKIYRGETSKSTPDNMSWTLSKKTAMFFANRFNSHGEVKTKTVKVSDLLDYLTSRGEEEVFYIKP